MVSRNFVKDSMALQNVVKDPMDFITVKDSTASRNVVKDSMAS
jgi:hypothetical protein